MVAPGTVVRWPGEALEWCGLGDRSWPPFDGACWYALDLLTPQGPLHLRRRTSAGVEETTLRIAPYPYEVQRITLEDDSRVNLSSADLARVRRETARIAPLWSRESPRRFDLPLAPPLDPMPSGGRFGSRRFFNDQPRSPHSGADYSAPSDATVFAVADGSVALSGEFFFSGRSLFIDHGDGLISMYFHLNEMEVDEGEAVRRGQRIGRVGQTGRATGPHLHFGLRWRGARVDPAVLLAPTELVTTLE